MVRPLNALCQCRACLAFDTISFRIRMTGLLVFGVGDVVDEELDFFAAAPAIAAELAGDE